LQQAYLSSDGGRILTVARNGRVDLWDVGSGAELLTLHTYSNTRRSAPCDIPMPSTDPELAWVAATPNLGNVLIYGQNGALALFTIPAREEAMRRARELVSRSLTPEERRRFLLGQ
jgi:hypothetical protein